MPRGVTKQPLCVCMPEFSRTLKQDVANRFEFPASNAGVQTLLYRSVPVIMRGRAFGIITNSHSEHEMTNYSRSSQTRSTTGTILIVLSGVVLGLSSIVKFAGVPAVVHKMALAGFTDKRLLLVAAL